MDKKMTNVYRVTRHGVTRSFVAKSEMHAALFAVKHLISAVKYTCQRKVVNDAVVYEVMADNFYIDVTVEPADEKQGVLL
jgi:hypothetical protein